MLFCQCLSFDYIDDLVVHNQVDLERKMQSSDFHFVLEAKTNFGKPTLRKANQNKSSKQKPTNQNNLRKVKQHGRFYATRETYSYKRISD